MNQITEELIVAIRLFSYWLGNGTINEEILPKKYQEEYLKALIDGGSVLEQIYTIFLRNIKNENGKIQNFDYAQKRAAEWIREYIDTNYHPDKPISPEECELGDPSIVLKYKT